MSLLANNFVTQLDNAKSEANQKALILGTAIFQINEFLQDMVFDAANDGLSNKTGIITSTGTSSYARFNQGIPYTKISFQDQLDRVEVLVRKILLPNLLSMTMQDKEAKLQQWLRAHREGLSVDMTNDILYGNPLTNIDQMYGLTYKMNSGTFSTVFKAAASGSALTSIYVLTHGLEDLYGFYPQPGDGTPDQEQWNSGVSYVMRQNVYVNDPSNNGTQFFGEVHELMWGLGFSIVNQRTQARACNIPTGSLTSTAWNQAAPNTGGYEIDDIITHTMNQMQNIHSGSRVIYMNRVIWDYFSRQVKHKANNFITPMVLEGYPNPFNSCNGAPIRFVEQIRNNETQVT